MISGPEAAWDTLMKERFIALPNVLRYPEDFEKQINGRPVRMYGLARYIDDEIIGREHSQATRVMQTCTILECFWAFHNRNPNMKITMETFLESYTCS